MNQPTVPDAAKPEQCHLRACDQSTGREYFVRYGGREELQAEADRMNALGRDYFVHPPLAAKPEGMLIKRAEWGGLSPEAQQRMRDANDRHRRQTGEGRERLLGKPLAGAAKPVMTPEQINEVNDSLWAELDEIKEKTGYNEYRQQNLGVGHWTLLGYLLNLKHRAAKPETQVSHVSTGTVWGQPATATFPALPATQVERAELIRLAQVAIHECPGHLSQDWQVAAIRVCKGLPALLAAGPARVEPLSEDKARAAFWGSYPQGNGDQSDIWMTAVRWACAHRIGKDQAS